jgi:hypothetical protein
MLGIEGVDRKLALIEFEERVEAPVVEDIENKVVSSL